MRDEPRFLPWRPNDPNALFAGVRLLVLGESHYEEPSENVFDHNVLGSDFSIAIVKKWGCAPTARQRFFANLYEMMIGEPWQIDADHGRLWQHASFYNYVQFLVSAGAGKTPTKSQFDASAGQFRAVLEMIRPHAVIVMGERLWQAMPVQDEWLDGMTGELGRVCAYSLADGSKVITAHTWHPSAPGFSAMSWHPKVASFLASVTACDDEAATLTD